MIDPAGPGAHPGPDDGPVPAPSGASTVRTGRRSPVVAVVVAATVVLLDQLTKRWALDALADREIHLVWTLQLNLAFNTGMAFSRGQGLGPVIGVVALVVVVVMLVRLGREGGRLATLATGLIVGGALGNICDRLLRDRDEGFLQGAVVDFIDLQWFPIFNVADMAITVGGGLLVLGAVLTPRDPGPEARPAAVGEELP